MRKFIAFLCLLLCAHSTFAQSFPVPADLSGTTFWGSDGWNEQSVTYASGTTENHLGNGVATDGGTPPAAAHEFTDIATSNESSWLSTGTYNGTNGYKPLPPACLSPGVGTCGAEMKFRTTINATHILFDDPIRNYGQPGTSHCHTFFGNPSVNAYSTYASLRTHQQKSLAAGGAVNATGYWFPCFVIEDAFGDGKDYAVKPDYVVVYYQEEKEMAGMLQRQLLGQRYVTGFDMDNGEAWLQSKIDAANAQAGTANRYRIHSGAGARSFGIAYQCTDSAGTVVDQQASLTDLVTCPSTGQMIAEFSGARCWDGVNLWSPGGYKHIIPEIWDTQFSEWVCPNGWFRVPGLQIKVFFSHEGLAGTRGLNNWTLSCDAAASSVYGAGYEAGMCFHTDWFNAWLKRVLKAWHENCLGANGVTPHECDSSVFSATEGLLYGAGAPNGRANQVDLLTRNGTATAGAMWEIPTSHNGPKTIDIHGH